MARSHLAGLCLLAYVQCWLLRASAAYNHTNSTHDGLGIAYAESCQSKLFAYTKSSLAYYSALPSLTSYYTATVTGESEIPGTTSASSLTTLCDGHPRVVGSVLRRDGRDIRFLTTYTNTNYERQSTGFTQQPPCSIGPKDCELLYSSWTSAKNLLPTSNQGLYEPPCTTSTLLPSYSRNSAGKTCDNCLVAGSKARLLYWPITTVPGSGDLCNKTAITIPGTRTADGPNTFVTDGITLTSPTVAVSIAGLSRVDGCGTTISTTIIPVNPEEVSSVRGYRAVFTHKPFNFADLNWHCPDGEYFTNSGHHNCYQEVPADAYFDGTSEWAGLDAMHINWRTQKNLTIWENYNPQLVHPDTMTKAVTSIWGKNCYLHPDGVWDPPIALQKADSVKGPVYTPAGSTKSRPVPTAAAAPATYTAEYATQTSGDVASTTPHTTALPNGHGGVLNPNGPNVNGPAMPQPNGQGGVPNPNGPNVNGPAMPQPNGQGGVPNSNGPNVNGPATPQPDAQPPNGDHEPAPSGNSPPSHGGGGNDQGHAGLPQGEPPSSQIVVIHSVTFTLQVQSNAAEVLTNSQTHFTLPNAGVNSAPVVVLSDKTYTVSAAPGNGAGSGYYVIGDGTTVPIEQAPTTLQGSERTASSSGPAGGDTTEISDRRSGPPSTSSTVVSASSQSSTGLSPSPGLQGSAASILDVSRVAVWSVVACLSVCLMHAG